MSKILIEHWLWEIVREHHVTKLKTVALQAALSEFFNNDFHINKIMAVCPIYNTNGQISANILGPVQLINSRTTFLIGQRNERKAPNALFASRFLLIILSSCYIRMFCNFNFHRIVCVFG